ncbi:MAG: hypothetical protein RMK91_10470 [Pseudanabaenaceae cyanobacterium SKYGB_i_bin29]|nr:hypothetical protein [Pseudanabaenaceae cyanobacterium SKYG29]MDW8422276.1 hypothetical protein [Pseudanabaenaceae cyanobacterium SKYGB_i_bin29]
MSQGKTDRLEQEIRDLTSAIAALEHRIQVLYGEYAQVLAQVARKQLILAAFNICTHVYPAQFLQLAPSDRQSLQSGVVAIADTLGSALREILAGEVVHKGAEEIDRLLNTCLEEHAHRVNALLQQFQVLPPLTENTPRVILRLAEIEFTDRYVMSQRGELRVLVAQRERLQGQLEEKRQAKLVLEAEEAWRSTWTESL